MLYQLSYASVCVATSLEEVRSARRGLMFRGHSRAITLKRIAHVGGKKRPVFHMCDSLADEGDVGFHRDDSAVESHLKELADSFPSVFAVVQRALVDVHSNELIGERGI